MTSIINKGTCSGGSNTNYYGKKFEEKTNNENFLLEQGYERIYFNNNKKHNYYLIKIFDDKKIIFIIQKTFKLYIKNNYNIDVFRFPDEAYIIEYNTGEKIIKILEKKEQNVEGSVEIKLWSGPSLKREYEIIFADNFKIIYAFCVNEFLKNKLLSNNKKYEILNQILDEHNINVLYGDDDDYFDILNIWINNFL